MSLRKARGSENSESAERAETTAKHRIGTLNFRVADNGTVMAPKLLFSTMIPTPNRSELFTLRCAPF